MFPIHFTDEAPPKGEDIVEKVLEWARENGVDHSLKKNVSPTALQEFAEHLASVVNRFPQENILRFAISMFVAGASAGMKASIVAQLTEIPIPYKE